MAKRKEECKEAKDRRRKDPRMSNCPHFTSDFGPDLEPILIGPQRRQAFENAYKMGTLLGKGGFGKVYAGERTKDSFSVATKVIKMEKITRWCKNGDQTVPLEICLLRKTSNIDGVIHLLDFYRMPDIFILILERPAGSKDLYDFINDYGCLNESLSRDFLNQILKTILACHQRGIIHRDIKDKNLLVTLSQQSKPRIHLIDFGSGAHIQNETYSDFAGTRVYAPPEWFQCGHYDGNQAAVWSIGILIYTMIYGNIPFKTNEEICTAKLKFQGNTSLECQDLIKCCLRRNPRKRILLDDILCHPWMDELHYNSAKPSPEIKKLE